MSLERGTLVVDGNLVNEPTLCLITVKDMNEIARIFNALRYLYADAEIVFDL
jgi:hypothetical protein